MAAAVAAIATADLLLAPEQPRLVIALLDEPAHVATTWLVVSAVAPRHTRAALIASTVLDADHVPSELGSDILRRGAKRPYGHTGAAVAAAGLIGGAGAALGVAAHLLRDLSGGPGVSLAWPLRGDAYGIPAPLYWLAVATAAARVASRTDAPGPPRPAP